MSLQKEEDMEYHADNAIEKSIGDLKHINPETFKYIKEKYGDHISAIINSRSLGYQVADMWTSGGHELFYAIQLIIAHVLESEKEKYDRLG